MLERTARFMLAGLLTIILAPAADSAVVADPTGRARDRVVVKFATEARVRLRGLALVSLSGRDISTVARVLAAHGPSSIERLFAREEASIEATRVAAEARQSVPLPDLNDYYEIAVFSRPARKPCRRAEGLAGRRERLSSRSCAASSGRHPAADTQR